MRLFVFFELFAVLQQNEHQARESLLKPQGLLERYCCHQKIGESCVGKSLKKSPNSGLSNKLFGEYIFPRRVTFHAQIFGVSTPNAFHQVDLIFLPHDKLPCGRECYKYALTVVDVASRYKEAEPRIWKNSAEVAKLGCPVDLQAQPSDLAGCCRLTLAASSWKS